MYSYGMGIHADLLDPGDIVMMAKWLVVAEIMYAFNLGWTKLSLLMMYYRIFHVPYFKNMAFTVGAFVMAWVVCVTFLFIFICVPVQKLWYPDLPGHCINQVATWIANAASTILTDLVIILMPMPQLWKLQLQEREKIGLTLAFSLGFLYVDINPFTMVHQLKFYSSVVFASAYRTSVLFTYDASDPSYTLAPTVGWTAIEMSAGIVSACLPTMLPVANLVLQILGLKNKSKTTRNGSSNNLWSQWSKSSTSEQKNTSRITPNSNSPLANNNLFYKLSDENSSSVTRETETLATPSEARLRPDVKGYKYSIKSLSQEERSEGTDNGIPLRGIRVNSVFERSTVTK